MQPNQNNPAPQNTASQREQIELETKQLERDKIAIEIAKLKRPLKEPTIWIGTATTILTLILTGIINFEPLKRQVEISRLRNELEELKLQKKAIELEDRKKRFESDSLRLGKGLESLQGRVVDLSKAIDTKQNTIIDLQSKYAVIDKSIKSKQDSLLNLKGQIVSYDQKVSSLNEVNHIEQFNGSYNGISQYVGLLKNPDFNKCVDMVNKYDTCRQVVSNTLDSPRIDLANKIMMTAILYRKDLRRLDDELYTIIHNESASLSNLSIVTIGEISEFYSEYSIMPSYCQEFFRQYFRGNLPNYDSDLLKDSFERKEVRPTDIVLKKWFKVKADGIIDTDELFKDINMKRELQKFIYYKALNDFASFESSQSKKVKIYGSARDALVEKLKFIALFEPEISLYYSAKLRLLISNALTNYSVLESEEKEYINKLSQNFDPTFPKAKSSVDQWQDWFNKRRLNNKNYTVDVIN